MGIKYAFTSGIDPNYNFINQFLKMDNKFRSTKGNNVISFAGLLHKEWGNNNLISFAAKLSTRLFFFFLIQKIFA